MRDPGAHEIFHELSARQWRRMSQAVLALLRRVGREPIIPIEDLIELLYGILERSTARALIEDDEEVDALVSRSSRRSPLRSPPGGRLVGDLDRHLRWRRRRPPCASRRRRS